MIIHVLGLLRQSKLYLMSVRHGQNQTKKHKYDEGTFKHLAFV